MKKIYKYAFLIALFLCAIILLAIFIRSSSTGVLDPKGTVAAQERNLIITALLLMLVVAIPVYILLFTFARKYRADNTKAKYAPDMDHNPLVGIILWAIPVVVISIIGVMIWKTTHALDPYKPIASTTKPLAIQVVALRWKWLFIYPEQNIATVNFIQFPEGTPVDFQLTADAPMSSFWIPQLGGQMYAMSGMSTQLHLIADAPGDFRGSTAEINGAGFSGMKFIARSSSEADFDAWVQSVKGASTTLSLDEYNKLAEPSENSPEASYASVEKDLYNAIIAKFMPPASAPTGSQANPMSAMPVMKTQ